MWWRVWRAGEARGNEPLACGGNCRGRACGVEAGVPVITLRTFQRRFIKAATAPGIDTAAMSLPRGNGKSFLASQILTRVLTPSDDLFRPGTESVLCAASIEQARIVFRFARENLEPTGEYRFLDSHTRIGITHKATNTKLRVIGSNGKTAMGLVNTPWAVCDEPGSWEIRGGQLLADAIETAKGKPGSPLRALYIGTLAPATAGWWHDLIDGGSRGTTVVHALRGDPEKWEKWSEIRRCNPLTAVSPEFRKKLLAERDEARADSRLKGRFLSYRLNVPSADESTVLLTVDDWKRVCAREVPERAGRPIVGYDAGHSRAWSAAVAVWRSGRIEAIALAPGNPNIEAQEKRDRVPRGTYRVLVENGSLRVAEGLRVTTPALLHAAAVEAFGLPDRIIHDRFLVAELKDAVRGSVKLVERIPRWSDSDFDIRALRKLALDGPLAVAPSARPLLTASLAAALVKNEGGLSRMVKRDTNNTGRDDVAAALVLAAGSLQRNLAHAGRRGGLVYHGMAG